MELYEATVSELEDYFKRVKLEDLTRSEINDVYLDPDNRKFVPSVIEWALENEYMSLEITSTYVLHKLSEEFMAVRVLYYWDRIHTAWKNKRR